MGNAGFVIGAMWLGLSAPALGLAVFLARSGDRRIAVLPARAFGTGLPERRTPR